MSQPGGRRVFPLPAAVSRVLGLSGTLIALAGAGGGWILARDCNQNGAADALDVASAASGDCNQNGIPDECDIAPGGLRTGAPVVSEGPPGMVISPPLVDMDGDGMLDLLGHEANSRQVWVLPGLGGGSFGVPAGIDLGDANAESILAPDLNGDGRPDLVVSGFSFSLQSFSLIVLLSGEDGRLGAATHYRDSMQSVFPVVAADLDQDGDVDVAAGVIETSSVHVRWNDGKGALSDPRAYPGGNRPRTLATADLNGDGRLEIVVSSNETPDLHVLQGKGGALLEVGPSIRAAGPVWRIRVADLDRNGDDDLVCVHSWGVTVQLSSGGESGPPVFLRGGQGIYDVNVADLDGDGAADLAVLESFGVCAGTDARFAVHLNEGAGSFLPPVWTRTAGYPYTLASGDLDRDRDTDLVVIFFPDGGNGPSRARSYLVERGATSLDEDRDGAPDECALRGRDCNWNDIPDEADVRTGASRDCDGNGVPDECDPDCNRNGSPNSCDLASGLATDADRNGLPDDCPSSAHDCNENGLPDPIDIASGESRDCNSNGLPDECEVSSKFQFRLDPEDVLAFDSPPGRSFPADLDQDGDLDLAVSIRGACCDGTQVRGGVAILMTEPGGSIVHTGVYAADGDPEALVAADLDGDLDLDWAVINGRLDCRGDSRIGILWNQAAGGACPEEFLRGAGTAVEGDSRSAVSADFDQDGDVDLVLGNADQASNKLLLVLNDGRGGLAPLESFGERGRVLALAAGDFDGDGRVDLAAADVASDAVSVHLNEGGGHFREPSRRAVAGGWMIQVAATDLDGDGGLDLVAGGYTRGDSLEPRLFVHSSEEGGRFAPPVSIPLGVNPESLMVSDFDGDAHLDVAAVGPMHLSHSGDPRGGVHIVRSAAGRAFEDGPSFPTRTPTSLGATADMDQDGDADIILTSPCENRLTILRNGGGARFQAKSRWPITAGVRVLASGDFDGDGDEDLAAPDDLSNTVLLLWTEVGLFRPATLRDGVPRVPTWISAGDLDGDGDLDLAVAGAFRVAIFENAGKGVFRHAKNLPVGSNPIQVELGDFDQDGRLDVATVNALFTGFSDNATILLNGGSFSFTRGGNFSVGVGASSIAASDVDHDGDLDLAATTFSAPGLVLLENLGGGSFSLAVPIAALETAYAVEGADMDGDGDGDLVVSDDVGIHLLRRESGGVFRATRINEHGGTRFELADLDLDLDFDLALITPGMIRVYGNRGDGTFAESAGFEMAYEVSPVEHCAGGQGGSGDTSGSVFITSGDLTGDARPDLVVLSGNETFLVFQNETVRRSPDLNGDGAPDECGPLVSFPFQRSDANQDGKTDISDPIRILRHLFTGEEELPCRAAADSNDDGRVDVSDSVALLRFLYLGEAPPAEPFPSCGLDPTEDAVGCESRGRC